MVKPNDAMIRLLVKLTNLFDSQKESYNPRNATSRALKKLGAIVKTSGKWRLTVQGRTALRNLTIRDKETQADGYEHPVIDTDLDFEADDEQDVDK